MAGHPAGRGLFGAEMLLATRRASGYTVREVWTWLEAAKTKENEIRPKCSGYGYALVTCPAGLTQGENPW